ncbi:hypothetical protein BJY04DRAFT_224019 [Aspergillus karnatakaensis]|uniref:uncharacterized protein n=1 Tax=Aspergillus karnatakaensis TaxID=1810916 RepID=UPI003CCCAC42
MAIEFRVSGEGEWVEVRITPAGREGEWIEFRITERDDEWVVTRITDRDGEWIEAWLIDTGRLQFDYRIQAKSWKILQDWADLVEGHTPHIEQAEHNVFGYDSERFCVSWLDQYIPELKELESTVKIIPGWSKMDERTWLGPRPTPALPPSEIPDQFRQPL